MNRIYLIITFFILSKTIGQTVAEINQNIKLSEKLNTKELRIYKWYSITNGSELFRIYQLENGNWNSEFYKYYNSTSKGKKPRFEFTKLKPICDFNLIWLNLLESNIEFLPSITEIDYKLRGKSEIKFEQGEYEIYYSQIKPLDGNGYFGIIQNGTKTNSIDFGNYESYLKNYPEVDELNSYSKLILEIKKGFNIWQN